MHPSIKGTENGLITLTLGHWSDKKREKEHTIVSTFCFHFHKNSFTCMKIPSNCRGIIKNREKGHQPATTSSLESGDKECEIRFDIPYITYNPNAHNFNLDTFNRPEQAVYRGNCMCARSIPGERGASYAPGMGTASYTCSPGAAPKCSCWYSRGASAMSGDLWSTGGEGVRSRGRTSVATGVKPICWIFGVAPVTRIGGAWSLNGAGCAIWFASTYCTSPSSTVVACL